MSNNNVNLGEITPTLNYNECSLVSFKVIFRKAYNFTKYAVMIELLADMNDTEGPVKVAILSKVFDVKDYSKSMIAMIDWDVYFKDVVIALPPSYNYDIDFSVRVIGINAVKRLSHKKKYYKVYR